VRIPPDFVFVHDNVAIKGFFGQYRWLSNMYPTPLHYEGEFFPSSENAYQAGKCPKEDHWPNARSKFKGCSPFQAKTMGQKVTLPANWEKGGKIEVMRAVLRCKFANPQLRRALLDTGRKHLEEANWWGDTFWGTVNGIGENWLGRLLMELREELRQAA
jgi:ribA/ribD-fused uncharacterized protein